MVRWKPVSARVLSPRAGVVCETRANACSIAVIFWRVRRSAASCSLRLDAFAQFDDVEHRLQTLADCRVEIERALLPVAHEGAAALPCAHQPFVLQPCAGFPDDGATDTEQHRH